MLYELSLSPLPLPLLLCHWLPPHMGSEVQQHNLVDLMMSRLKYTCYAFFFICDCLYHYFCTFPLNVMFEFSGKFLNLVISLPLHLFLVLLLSAHLAIWCCFPPSLSTSSLLFFFFFFLPRQIICPIPLYSLQSPAWAPLSGWYLMHQQLVGDVVCFM